MSLRRSLDTEGIRHSNADSATHARHVEHRKEERKRTAEPVVEPDPASVFKLNTEGLDLPNGLYFTGIGDGEKPASGEEFENHLSAANWTRRFHYAPMRRGDKISLVRRKAKGPAIGETVVNLSPWQMTWINCVLEQWEKAGVSAEDRTKLLTAFLSPLRLTVVDTFRKETGRDCIGSYVHLDSNKLHVGVISSRTNAQNQLVGEKFLRTVGPWSVAQFRIGKIGAAQEGDFRLRENLERFRARHGDRVPLDIQLHEALDLKFEELVGKTGSEGGGADYEMAKADYRKWKAKARKEAVLRHPSTQRITFDVIRLVTPLFPPQVQAALRLAHTAVQVIQVISAALEAISPPPAPGSTRQKELQKNL